MEEKESWNAQKKELWKLPTNKLMLKLQELQTNLMKIEMKARGFGGDPSVPFLNNRIGNTTQEHWDIKGLRHKIACIKTMLNVKGVQQNGNGIHRT